MALRASSAARERLFYGWIIVAVGFTAQFLLAGFSVYALAAFLKPMSDDLGWSRATLAGVLSLGNAIGGLAAPFIGPIIDKRGGRGLMILGTVIAGAGFVGTAFVRSPLEYYLVRGVLVAVGMACATALTVNVAIANWFIRMRGRAMAVGIMGTSLASAVLTPLAVYLIAIYGWRMAWALFGIATWVVIIPPVARFFKRRPEDIGLLPDGDLPRVEGQGSRVKERGTEDRGLAPDPQPLTPEPAWTRREAARTSALWLAMLAFGLVQMSGMALAVHALPFLTDIGLSVAVAAAAVSAQGITAFAFKPVWGVLIDRYHVRTCGMAAFAASAVGVATFVAMSQWPWPWLVFFGNVFLGIGYGGLVPTQDVFWPNYFGRFSLGAIRSLTSPLTVGFGASGPILAGWVYDRFGSYQLVLAFFSISFALAAVLLYLARQPQKRF